MYVNIVVHVFGVYYSSLHLAIIHNQSLAAKNLLSILSTLPSMLALADCNNLRQVTSFFLCTHY